MKEDIKQYQEDIEAGVDVSGEQESQGIIGDAINRGIKKKINMTKAQEQVNNYEVVCNELAEYFANKYFGKDYEMWWVADQIGSVMYINDYFFNMENMVDYLRYSYSVDDMFEYHEYSLKCATSGDVPPICIRDYKAIKKTRLNTK